MRAFLLLFIASICSAQDYPAPIVANVEAAYITNDSARIITMPGPSHWITSRPHWPYCWDKHEHKAREGKLEPFKISIGIFIGYIAGSFVVYSMMRQPSARRDDE